MTPRDLENLVKDLQRDLNQRDKEIQRLREEGFSVASYTGGSPPSSPFVMSPGGGSPTSRDAIQLNLNRIFNRVRNRVLPYRVV